MHGCRRQRRDPDLDGAGERPSRRDLAPARVASDAADLGSATGAALRGEVEDWAVSVRTPRLEVTRATDAQYVPAAAGGAVRYTVPLHNPGPLPMTTERPAYLYDEVAATLDDAELGALTASVGTASVVGSRITWSGPLAVGASVTVSCTSADVNVRSPPGPASRRWRCASRPPRGRRR